ESTTGRARAYEKIRRERPAVRQLHRESIDLDRTLHDARRRGRLAQHGGPAGTARGREQHRQPHAEQPTHRLSSSRIREHRSPSALGSDLAAYYGTWTGHSACSFTRPTTRSFSDGDRRIANR